MSLDLLERGDPEHDSSPSTVTRLSRRILGDPRKAPKRLATLAVFALFAFIAFGLWLLANSQIDTSGSSAPIAGPLLEILTSVWLVPVLALWFTRRWVLYRRQRYANKAADVTGWRVGTVEHLRDEVKTTDGCTRVIASTGNDYEEIQAKIDAALAGETDDDTLEFWGQNADDGGDETTVESDGDVSSADYTRREALLDRHNELVAEYEHRTDRIDDLLADALEGDIELENVLAAGETASLYELMDEGSVAAVDEAEQLLEECEQIESELEGVRDELDAIDEAFDGLIDGLATAGALADELADAGYDPLEHGESDGDTTPTSRRGRVRAFLSGLTPGFGRSKSDSTAAKSEDLAPWRVRFMGEVKHLWLDLQSGFRTGDAVVKFGVPAAMTFGLQLLVVGLWTTLPVYGLFLATSTLVGVGSYWLIKRRRQRRLRRYRTRSEGGHWLDCAGQFKTVETPDVTAYVGFIAGNRYAAYDRELFVEKAARTMYQHVSDECVSPSELEHYARSLAQMKPNLKGHRQNVLEPAILRDIKQTVEASEDDLIPKAELAWEVIEQPTSSRIQTRLGHDPDLVAAQYQYLIEDAHVLDERDVEFMDANGETNTLTLVFPAEKQRLPDVSERHSQFSDRFSDKKGDPVYELPAVDPRDDLSGFVPSPETAARFGALEAGPAAQSD